jgi:hypothetical protein
MGYEIDRYTPFKELKQQGNWPPPDWILSIKPIVPLIKELGDNITGCEIGINFGISMIYTLDEVPAIKKLYGIDPFDGRDGDVILSEAKACFVTNMNDGYKDRIEFIENYSDLACSEIPDGSLDYIFIDGLHTYDQLLKDCKNYYSKVRSGGLFSGHDWPMPELQKAVYEFMDLMKIPRSVLKVTEDNGVWYWTKE